MNLSKNQKIAIFASALEGALAREGNIIANGTMQPSESVTRVALSEAAEMIKHLENLPELNEEEPNREVSIIRYNWWGSVSDGREIFGEEYQERIVGKNSVVAINEGHDGSRLFYDIDYSDGTTTRVFNPNTVIYK